ncbi:CBS domain-containing protein [Ponticoccus sp. SC2-23]|uniref:CBS domain-containing protein n=1 Tax=Alexandriicola marinus TaxID=2081710 RepID=UPI000FDA1192|nr:CBS domain-containing protein [Alexandriicola marinus]MBM1219282.1 CBS domain-containing protein [Ponticoccus sp. SC6-9]MBM1223646.1 CBS domain-containing protein [Ponticoccus sp. SC6-15]MBM1229095.1 CBS domain-containing protein [Ponticoccus sp. SC6-38]MBM1232612.1 CBS domain-containing protein [Ponticoccus sp. SC6-45]MBM1237438.1 CBS domain-containing protein [Ponticoccus sp. SC6-49]MBM1241623.1 CBS domain-containing protein [Ponticoccus sp. SC2-64]MBM1246136.1 CBS domain-containing pro
MLVMKILESKADSSVLTVPGTTNVSDVVALLSEKRLGTVVVSEDGTTPAGILSERDIVRELGKRGPGCLSETAQSMMTRDPVTCAPEDSAHAVLEKMTDGRFRHLPVMRDGEMIGLISIGDVVKARLSELAMEKTALEDMISGR